MDVQGQGVCGKSLYLPPNFIINLKLLLKIILKSYFEKEKKGKAYSSSTLATGSSQDESCQSFT